jgi:hypothetical protein
MSLIAPIRAANVSIDARASAGEAGMAVACDGRWRSRARDRQTALHRRLTEARTG